MQKILLLCAVLLGAAVIGVFTFQREQSQGPEILWRPVVAVAAQALRSDYVRAGTVISSDPLLIPAPFKGTVTELAEDETWVEAGSVVVRLDNEEADTQVSALLANKETKIQEIALLRQERDLAEAEEALKARNAERALEIHQARLRILTTTPVGGRRLIELDQQLLPLEKKLDAKRDILSDYQRSYQQAQQAWLRAQDAMMDAKDAWLEAQLSLDLGEDVGPVAHPCDVLDLREVHLLGLVQEPRADPDRPCVRG